MITFLGPESDLKLLCLSPRPPLIFDASDSDVSSMIPFLDCYELFLSAMSKCSLDVALATPANHMQAYVFLSMAIYLFSNNLVDEWDPGQCYCNLFAKLDIVFALIPQEHLQVLLKSRLSSIRAAWEQFLIVAGLCKQARFFRTMVDVGFANHWFSVSVSEMGHEYLWLAASMGLTGVIRRLLSIGCRPDQGVVDYFEVESTGSVIVDALNNSEIECAHLLLKDCEVNRLLGRNPQDARYYDEVTTFQIFSRQHLSSSKDWSEYLQMFVNADANLDAAFISEDLYTDYCLHEIIPESRPEWWPSILDGLFYFERPAFDRFRHYSQAFTSKVTRAGVFLALEKNGLECYLSEARESNQVDIDDINGFLQAILFEQFIIARSCRTPKRTNLEVVHALLDFGIDFPSAALPRPPRKTRCTQAGSLQRQNQASFALHILVRQIQGQPQEFLRHEIQALQLLIDHGAIVTNGVLQDAVQSQGTDLLEFLIPYMDDIAKQGRYALAEAATRENIEVVILLLGARVDINSELRFGGHSVSILAYVLIRGGRGKNTNEMVRLLVGRGAIIRLSKKKPRPSDLLKYLISDQGPGQLRWLSVRYVIEQTLERQDPLMLSSSMLEYCYGFDDMTERRAVFEYLYRKGAHVRSGAVLATWILLDGGIELVRELLDAGADIDCHLHSSVDCHRLSPLQAAADRGNEEVVLLLLKEGATVNAPALGRRGYTALQAICSFDAFTQDEQARKIRIINSLIDNGANINAAPAWCAGYTALQLTALRGDLETAILLLQKGADVNAPPCKRTTGRDWKPDNALDTAAEEGRLDLVKLLLNANALSEFRGDTGYDGAIELAENTAVAELIRQHAAQIRSDEELKTLSEYLSHPPRDWHEYEDEWGTDYETLDPCRSYDVSSSDDEEAYGTSDRFETVPSANHDYQEDVSVEGPDHASAAVDQDMGFLSEGGEFNHIAFESVWTGATNSTTRGDEHLGGYVIEEPDVSHSDPVLSALTHDDSLVVWKPERWPGS